MADPKIRIRRSATPNKVPLTSQLQLGELAINTFDGKLYLEQDQTGASGIATVIVVNPWSVGLGSLTYDTFFTAGNVGVGTTVPTQLLDVAGDIRLRGAIFDSNNTTGTANQILVSRAGAGVSWANITSIPVGDANTLDGLDSTQFLRSDADDTATGLLTLSGGISVSAASTFTGPITIGNTMSFGDNDRLRLGDGQDLQIYHNSANNNSIIQESGSGNLVISGTNIAFRNGALSEEYALFTENGSVELYYNNSKKFETSGIGVTIYNRLDVDDINASGIVTATQFVGDGSLITGLSAEVGVVTNTTNQAQIIPFALGYGATTGFGATDGFVFNPSTTRLGIGSATPAYALDVVGDINSSTDVKINGTGVLDTALALAIALG